jgi:mannosyltransferase OCH1-like enzyme
MMRFHIRYNVLMQFVMLDCDFELLAPLDELFTEEHDLYLLASSNTPNVITNGFMACKPGRRYGWI